MRSACVKMIHRHIPTYSSVASGMSTRFAFRIACPLPRSTTAAARAKAAALIQGGRSNAMCKAAQTLEAGTSAPMANAAAMQHRQKHAAAAG